MCDGVELGVREGIQKDGRSFSRPAAMLDMLSLSLSVGLCVWMIE